MPVMSTGGVGVEGATVAWVDENQCISGVMVYPFRLSVVA